MKRGVEGLRNMLQGAKEKNVQKGKKSAPRKETPEKGNGRQRLKGGSSFLDEKKVPSTR